MFHLTQLGGLIMYKRTIVLSVTLGFKIYGLSVLLLTRVPLNLKLEFILVVLHTLS